MLDIYTLMRNWFNWSFENPKLIKPNHTALYFFCIEHCNRLGWKSQFGLPTEIAKEAIGIRSYNTYKDTFEDLEKFGFIKVIERSKNQYSSNIIALSKYDKAFNKALDKALIKHSTKQSTKQSESTHESIDSIDIQIDNTTNLQTNNLTNIQLPPIGFFEFEKRLIEYGFEKNLIVEWLSIRKKKKAVNSETAFNGFIEEIEKCKDDKNEILKYIITKSWQGFEAKWLDNSSYKKTETKGINHNTSVNNF